MFEGLLQTKRPTSKIYCIELDDQKIDHQLSIIIKTVQEKLQYFHSHINENTLIMKEDRINEMQEELIPCTKDIRKLSADIKQISTIEHEHEDHLLIKDKQFLIDKQQQLTLLSEELEHILSILREHPSKEALQHELIEELQAQLYTSKEAITKLLTDDTQLQLIYKSIIEL